MKSLLLLLLLAVPAFAQDSHHSHGSVRDLKGKTKVCVIASPEQLKLVEKDLAEHFVLVEKEADAEFVLEYHVLSQSKNDPHKLHSELDRLDAFFYRDEKKVTAWSESRHNGAFSSAVVTLTKDFLKAFSH
jgi:hypothetical protein